MIFTHPGSPDPGGQKGHRSPDPKHCKKDNRIFLSTIRLRVRRLPESLCTKARFFPLNLAAVRYKNLGQLGSVADPGCLSRIPDPKTATKARGDKKFVVNTFFVATNKTKLKFFFFFTGEENKNVGHFTKNYRTFYLKNCH
jgi:hypothetical protein